MSAFKQIGEHVDGCLGAADEDGIVFIVHDGIDWNRDKLGRRGGSTGWDRFRCNDTRCQAVLLVRWDVLARFINDGDDAILRYREALETIEDASDTGKPVEVPSNRLAGIHEEARIALGHGIAFDDDEADAS